MMNSLILKSLIVELIISKDLELKEELKKIKQFNLRVTRIILNSGEEEWLIK